MPELLNVDTALERILEQISQLPSTSILLHQALGRILSQDIIAPISLPPFANSSMDGYAVIAQDCLSATRQTPITLQVIMDITAGTLPQQPLKSGTCARIMTGAPLPEGADSVIPVELTSAKWSNDPNAPLESQVTLFASVKPADNVRPIGENILAGQTVITKGTPIRSAEIGILASLGYAQVNVTKKPRVAVLTSGDELLPLGSPLTSGKIYDSNSITIGAMIEEIGGEAHLLPIASDTLPSLHALFQQALALEPDMIISTAGVSVGAVDLVRTVLEELGHIGFWRINLRPGKPLAFGNIQNIPFFGLPGNPVSAMVTFEVLVRPALLKMQNRPDESHWVMATVAEKIESDGRRSYLRVRLTPHSGGYLAHLAGTQSSGALVSMLMADGLMIVPEGVKTVEVGAQLRVKLLRNVHI